MQQIGAGVREGGDVAGLHQLQGGFLGRGVAVAARGDHHALGEAVAGGERADLVLAGEEVRGEIGQHLGRGAVAAAQAFDEEIEGEQGGRVGLGGGQGLLGSGHDVEVVLGDGRQR